VVKFLHDKGKKVWVWTVDTPEELEMVKSYRVDGVISNRPKVMHLLQNNL
jgi:glycerophosphoryl diester phosphodiesterase